MLTPASASYAALGCLRGRPGLIEALAKLADPGAVGGLVTTAKVGAPPGYLEAGMHLR
jgi:hypothetical protein